MRLPRWLRRPTVPVPAGRHSRVLPGPLVPGAAASLVATTASAGLTETPDPVPEPVETASAPPAPEALAPSEPPHGGPVTLGFADGATLELADDDPRVRTFRAAAAALLEAPAR